MAAEKRKTEQHHPVAGPRADPLAVVTLAMLGLFVLVIVALIGSDVVYLVAGELDNRAVSRELAKPGIVGEI
ncbi:hypothetical protein LCGC14_2887300, partial [marine sediment metagenome]